METKQLTFGSLFAGIGGFDLGFERAGMVCKWQVEKDPFCQRVLAKHWPDIARYEDVREVGKHNLEPVDVICGGFPCQPHSVAGQRKGAADDRDLWPEYRRIIAEINPAFIVGENVPGIRTTILDSVLSDLENLNYSWQTLIIPACAFGAPHIRERVFILGWNVAHTKSGGCGFFNTSHIGQVNGESYSSSNGCKILAHTTGAGLERPNTTGTTRTGGWPLQRAKCYGWQPEPDVGRVANGVPNRVDRIRSLGNAVVPQVAEFIATLVIRTYNKANCTELLTLPRQAPSR